MLGASARETNAGTVTVLFFIYMQMSSILHAHEAQTKEMVTSVNSILSGQPVYSVSTCVELHAGPMSLKKEIYDNTT